MSDLEVVVLRLIAGFTSIDNRNSLFNSKIQLKIPKIKHQKKQYLYWFKIATNLYFIAPLVGLKIKLFNCSNGLGFINNLNRQTIDVNLFIIFSLFFNFYMYFSGLNGLLVLNCIRVLNHFYELRPDYKALTV